MRNWLKFDFVCYWCCWVVINFFYTIWCGLFHLGMHYYSSLSSASPYWKGELFSCLSSSWRLCACKNLHINAFWNYKSMLNGWWLYKWIKCLLLHQGSVPTSLWEGISMLMCCSKALVCSFSYRLCIFDCCLRCVACLPK